MQEANWYRIRSDHSMVLPRKKSTHWQTDLQRVGKGSGRLRKVGNQSHFTLIDQRKVRTELQIAREPLANYLSLAGVRFSGIESIVDSTPTCMIFGMSREPVELSGELY